MARTKQPAPPKEQRNRVWIELEVPKDGDNAIAEQRCKLANQMLAKLGVKRRNGVVFFWSERDFCYCVIVDDAGGFLVCRDNGHWFDLDHLAK